MKKLFKKILGIILLPFLFGRAGILVVGPFAYWVMQQPDFASGSGDTTAFELAGAFYFVWVIFYGCLFGNCNVMNSWTRMWHKILGIKFKQLGEWNTRDMHSFSIWRYPKVELNGKTYELSYAENGGNLYEWEANMRRTLIMKHLFN